MHLLTICIAGAGIFFLRLAGVPHLSDMFTVHDVEQEQLSDKIIYLISIIIIIKNSVIFDTRFSVLISPTLSHCFVFINYSSFVPRLQCYSVDGNYGTCLLCQFWLSSNQLLCCFQVWLHFLMQSYTYRFVILHYGEYFYSVHKHCSCHRYCHTVLVTGICQVIPLQFTLP